MNTTSNPRNKKFDKRLLIIFLIIFTETLGFSILLPVLPFLAISFGLNRFQAGLVLSVFSFCQFFASPITGKLSDRFGRKPLLLFSQTSTFVGFLLLGFANNVWLLILARLVDGLLGSNMTVSQAYISDTSDPSDRTRIYGYSSAVFDAALIFGPLIGGTFSAINYSIPMFFAGGISLLSIILVILFLPESLREREKHVKIKFEDIIPINNIKNFLKNSKTRGILVIFFIYTFGFMLFISSFALFAEKQVQVTPLELGFYLTWVGILRVGLQSFLIAPLQNKFGENKTLGMGIFAMGSTMIMLIFTTNYLFVYFPLIFLSFGTGVSRPILTSKLTKNVKKEETGSLLGVNNALGSIAQIITPILGGAMIEYLPSQILPASSAIFFLLIFLLWKWGLTNPVQEEKNII
ncbi:hypothetical protein LCGC14_1839250 [marine sediment metagenome]|uniref:Major facilitator superfamily (MFS) profile domain-containing protein n=1 Tax=marine sediment metagenome TaxID=412755 RepID=A0A0F9JD47_9ZZZZ|nr:MFS transporter [archaeon]